MSNRPDYPMPLWTILRLDGPASVDCSNIESYVTVVRVVADAGLAEAELARLNGRAAEQETDARYWLQRTLLRAPGTPKVDVVTRGGTPTDWATWWAETGEHELRQVLLWAWDPIGVSWFFPSTANEYDGYAARIIGKLEDGATPDDLAAFLLDLEREEMGLNGNAARCNEIALQLDAWHSGSKESWAEFGRVRR